MSYDASEITRRRKALAIGFNKRNNRRINGNLLESYATAVNPVLYGEKIALLNNYGSIPETTFQDFIRSNGTNPTLSDIVIAAGSAALLNQGPSAGLGISVSADGVITVRGPTGEFLGETTSSGLPVSTSISLPSERQSLNVWEPFYTNTVLSINALLRYVLGFAYGAGRYVAVGSNRIMTSTNGTNWTTISDTDNINTISGSRWSSVTYGNGLFVAVATSGTYSIATSEDGLVWTARTAPEDISWTSVTFGNGIFVAVASTGTNRIMTSEDGITWTAIAAPLSGVWNSVAFGNNMFMAIARNIPYPIKSADGINWTNPVSFGGGPSMVAATSLVYGNNSWVAVGRQGVARSGNDGSTWSVVIPYAGTDNWTSVTYGNGLFVALGSTGPNRLIYSSDGITWTRSTLPITQLYTTVQFVNNLFIGSAYASNSSLMTSSDGINWSYIYTPGSDDYRGIVYANGQFIAVAHLRSNPETALATSMSPEILVSNNGYDWTLRQLANITIPIVYGQIQIFNSIVYGNGLYVAVGDLDRGNTITQTIMTSPDGINWTARASPRGSSNAYLAYGNGRFVAIALASQNYFITSEDGITWTERSLPFTSSVTSITYGNGMFVAVGFGTIKAMTSPDGITWTARSMPETNSWMSATYGNGMFVAVASDGTNRVALSTDGITWTPQSAAENNSWQAITYGNGMFVAVASSGTNKIMSSSDGITWIGEPSPNDYALWNVVYGDNKFVGLVDPGEVHQFIVKRVA